MKKQILASIKQRTSDKRAILSVGILLTNSLPINAQSSQNSFLPPEVMPTSQAVNYTSNPQYGNYVSTQAPGIVSQAQGIVTPQTMQTPQEIRQALYHSLMGSNIYPQFNGQSANQPNSVAGSNSVNINQPFNPSQSYNESTQQTLGNQMQTPADMQMAQSTNNPSPPQTQTLTGTTNTPTTSQQRTSGGISHLAGVVGGAGLSGGALAGMTSTGGIYSAGLLGASLLNYGLRSGMKF